MGSRIIKKKKGGKALKVAAVGLVLILAIAGFAYSRTDLNQAANNDAKYELEAKKLGLFFNSDEVAAIYNVDPADNSADILTPVLKIPKENKWDKPKNLTEEMVRSKWQEFETGIQAIEEASKRKHLIFKRDLSSPGAISYPQYSDLKAWVQLLSSMAHFASEKNDIASARRYLLDAAYICSVLDEEGTLIGALVRISSATTLETEMKKILSARGRDSAWQEVLQDTIKKLDKPYDLKRILAIEHWFAVWGVNAITKTPEFWGSMNGDGSVPPVIRFSKWIPRFKAANMSRVNETYVNLVSQLPSDPYDFASTRKAFTGMDQIVTHPGISYTVLSMVAPVFSNSSVVMAREVAQRNALEQALALLKPGANPENGLPLRDRRLRDIDGSNLRLKSVNGQWVIYSIWWDMIDDGGVESKNLKGDWVVHLPK